MSIILALLYPLAIQYERGGWWILITPLTVITLVIDVIANYTELALLTWDWPTRSEWTFSTRLKRLRHYPGRRGAFARLIVDYLNFFAPDGNHV